MDMACNGDGKELNIETYIKQQDGGKEEKKKVNRWIRFKMTQIKRRRVQQQQIKKNGNVF